MPKYTNRLKHKSHYENLPFEVPEGWCWSCIENVCSKFTTGPFGSMVHKSDYVIDGGVPMVNPANMIGGNISYNKLMFVSELRAKDLQRYRLEPSDILLARRGDLTKCVVIKEEQKDWLCGTGSFVLHTILLLPTYFELLYSSTYIQSILTSESVGATMDNLNQGLLSSIIIPIPPIEEQKRIVTTVGLWFSLIENLGVGYSELNQNISKAKSKILDLAIHGKLVPQDPNDEPASELLKRINPKFVPCDNPHYENVPFEIPDNWAWVRIDEINKFKSKSVNPQNYPTDQFELFSVPTFETGEPEFPFGKEVASSKVEVEESDVLLCKINPHLNRVWVVRRKMAQLKSLASSEWIVIRTEEIMAEYLALTMQSPYFRELMMSNVSGVGGSLMRAQPTFVKQYMIPIPPVSEQSRIVTKAREFFKTLDSIAESLN